MRDAPNDSSFIIFSSRRSQLTRLRVYIVMQMQGGEGRDLSFVEWMEKLIRERQKRTEEIRQSTHVVVR